MRRLLSVASLLAAFSAASAQHHQHDTGEKLGTVHFAVSCKPAASGEFDRAVALLHSFEFAGAINGFQSVLATDSTCAMAHWGIAMSRWTNPMAAVNRSSQVLQSGRLEVEAARKAQGGATDRERRYIAAVGTLYDDYEKVPQSIRVVAYEHAMNDLVARQPADTEAKIFYAIALVASASPSDKSYTNQRKAGKILEALWTKEPDHPGLAHYIIHAYDYPALAPEAAAAARKYAVIAPSAAHAQHMPSHIFTRTGLWQQSIDANLKSIRIAMASGSISEALHASDYAEYAYLQKRDYANAKKILETLPSLAAKFDPNAVTGAAPGSAGVFALSAIPARYALERDNWKEAADLKPASTSFPWSEAMTYFARSLGASHLKDFSGAQAAVDSLTSIRDRLAARDEPYWSEQVAIQRLSAQAWLDLAQGSSDSALAHMQEAVGREDATEKNAVTPGPLAPAREMYGDMLMQLHRPADALAEYEKTLKKEPNRARSIAGQKRARAAMNRKLALH
jgi:hypothetical protein